MQAANIISNQTCPVGCDDLMFVEGKTNHQVFFYCTGCALAFAHPKEAQSGSGEEVWRSLRELSPDGIILPSKEAVANAGFSSFIGEIYSGSAVYSADEINKDDY